MSIEMTTWEKARASRRELDRVVVCAIAVKGGRVNKMPFTEIRALADRLEREYTALARQNPRADVMTLLRRWLNQEVRILLTTYKPYAKKKSRVAA